MHVCVPSPTSVPVGRTSKRARCPPRSCVSAHFSRVYPRRSRIATYHDFVHHQLFKYGCASVVWAANSDSYCYAYQASYHSLCIAVVFLYCRKNIPCVAKTKHVYVRQMAFKTTAFDTTSISASRVQRRNLIQVHASPRCIFTYIYIYIPTVGGIALIPC